MLDMLGSGVLPIQAKSLPIALTQLFSDSEDLKMISIILE
jgi:hypothetical protein